MSRNHSLKGFSSTANTIRIESPEPSNVAPQQARQSRSQLVLRCTSTLFAIIAMSLFAASISYTNANYTNILGNGDWTDGFALAPTLLAILLNPILLLTQRRALSSPRVDPSTRSIIPCVVGDLVIIGLAVPSLVYAIGGGMYWNWAPAISSGDGTISCTFWYNDFSPECMPVAYTIGRCQIAAAVFLALLACLHLALFVTGLIGLARARARAANSGEISERDFELAVSKAQGPTSVYQ